VSPHHAPSRLFKKLKQVIAFAGVEILKNRSGKLVQTINHRLPIRCPDLLQSKNRLLGPQLQLLAQRWIRLFNGSIQIYRAGGTPGAGNHPGEAAQLLHADRKNGTGSDNPADPVMADDDLLLFQDRKRLQNLASTDIQRSEEHTSELQSRENLVC